MILPVLRCFASRADELMGSKRAALERAFDSVDGARLTEAAERLARFTGVKKLTIPVFPLASPAPGGGGMDGGRLRWEICDESVSPSVLLHEIVHGFFQQREADLQAVVDTTRSPNPAARSVGALAFGCAKREDGRPRRWPGR